MNEEPNRARLLAGYRQLWDLDWQLGPPAGDTRAYSYMRKGIEIICGRKLIDDDDMLVIKLFKIIDEQTGVTEHPQIPRPLGLAIEYRQAFEQFEAEFGPVLGRQRAIEYIRMAVEIYARRPTALRDPLLNAVLEAIPPTHVRRSEAQ
jgi:hypothetical protein